MLNIPAETRCWDGSSRGRAACQSFRPCMGSASIVDHDSVKGPDFVNNQSKGFPVTES